MSMKPVGTAVVAPNGSYVVKRNPAVDLNEFVDPSSQINLNVVIQTTSGAFADHVQIQPTSTARSHRAKLRDVTISVTGRSNIRLSPARRLTIEDRFTGRRRSSSALTPKKAVEQEITVVKDYGGRQTVVGTWYSDMKLVTHKFTYARGASSELGVAFSASGKAGTFSKEKTKSISTIASVGFGKQKGKGRWNFNTLFQYQKRHYRTCGGYICMSGYRIEPVAWWGGATRTKAANYSANFCVPMRRGTNWTINRTAAWTFSKGVANAGMTVVNLSSKTGFSHATTHKIVFNWSGRLCGKNSRPGQNPKALRAKPS